jgi:23S rRNA (uracil1939-C5)-methyltransferase
MPELLIDIESLDMEARGIGHLPNEDGSTGKVIFVEGALPGERVAVEITRRKAKWEAGRTSAVLRESSLRVKPKCPHFGVCGGCAMQHLDTDAQVAVKQRVLEDNLWHLAKLKPQMMLRPIAGPSWAYRYRARLSVRNVPKKGGILVGFHERHSRYIADMRSCEVMPRHVSAMLLPLRALIASLSIFDRLPQIELAVSDGELGLITALVLRNMAALTDDDSTKLRQFAAQHSVQWWLQPGGPDSVVPFDPDNADLHYLLPEFGIKMPFKPTDFTQVNHQINRLLVTHALRFLDLRPEHRVADLFCGLGNFTLPIATRVAQVVGIEGSKSLSIRAADNAAANGLAQKTQFLTRNLFEITPEDLLALERFDRMLIDPPRDGAAALCTALASLHDTQAALLPARIVYVSCNPATLARDAGVLVDRCGYALTHAGVINMFPHTAHVESMAVFERRTDNASR